MPRLSRAKEKGRDMVDVYVLGDGLPELAAALEFAEVGLSVRVGVLDREGRDEAWNALDDRGAHDPEGALRGLLDHVAAPLTDGERPTEAVQPVSEPPMPVLLRGAKGDWAPQPTPAVFGIPAVPVSSHALALLGGSAAVRAYLDRITPVLTIGKTHALGPLVRSRLGRAVLARLVEPLVRERFGVSADEVDVAIATPGLNEALTLAGSLSGAVLAYSERDVARETRVAPRGGWSALRDALLKRLALYGVEFGEIPVTAARRGGAAADDWVLEEGDGEVSARALVLGVEGSETVAIVSESVDALTELVPERWRIEGGATVEDPGVPTGHEGFPAVQTVSLPDGEQWSVRIESVGEAHLARVSGPVILEESGDGITAAAARARALEAIRAAGLGPRSAGEPTAAVRVAPYASTEQRDAAEERLNRVRAEAPDLLPVGTALHGGALSSAVADARLAAVLLRRRLTGISE